VGGGASSAAPPKVIKFLDIAAAFVSSLRPGAVAEGASRDGLIEALCAQLHAATQEPRPAGGRRLKLHPLKTGVISESYAAWVADGNSLLLPPEFAAKQQQQQQAQRVALSAWAGAHGLLVADAARLVAAFELPTDAEGGGGGGGDGVFLRDAVAATALLRERVLRIDDPRVADMVMQALGETPDSLKEALAELGGMAPFLEELFREHRAQPWQGLFEMAGAAAQCVEVQGLAAALAASMAVTPGAGNTPDA
jgi:hypothetical protein